MKKPHVYASVWTYVYALPPGSTFTISSVGEHVALESMTLWRAIKHAEEARIAVREPVPGQRASMVWKRSRLPSPLTVEWAVANGGRFTIAWSVLDALRLAGLLRLEAKGFMPVS